MASENQPLIFRFLNVDQLDREVEQKRRAFEASLDELRGSLRAKARPGTLLRDHPKVLLATLVSSASLLKMMSSWMFSSNGKNGSKKHGQGWPFLLGAFMGKMGLKFLMPVAVGTLKFALKKIAKRD